MRRLTKKARRPYGYYSNIQPDSGIGIALLARLKIAQCLADSCTLHELLVIPKVSVVAWKASYWPSSSRLRQHR